MAASSWFGAITNSLLDWSIILVFGQNLKLGLGGPMSLAIWPVPTGGHKSGPQVTISPCGVQVAETTIPCSSRGNLFGLFLQVKDYVVPTELNRLPCSALRSEVLQGERWSPFVLPPYDLIRHQKMGFLKFTTPLMLNLIDIPLLARLGSSQPLM